MNEVYQKHSLKIVLDLIGSSKLYLDAYIKEYPANISNAMSFSKNPNCSCRNFLIKHYNENTQVVDDFTSNFLEENPTEINWEEADEKHTQRDVSGKVFRIPLTDQAYEQFATQMKNEQWAFRFMNITIHNNQYVFMFV